MSLQLSFQTQADNDAYQVDLVTNIFSIMIIFLLIYLATQTVDLPKETDYVKKEPETANFTLLRQRLFRPFTDIYFITTDGFYQLDLARIAQLHVETTDSENTLLEKPGVEIFIKSLHPRNQRDFNSFLLTYTPQTSPSQTTYGLQALGNETEQFLSWLAEHTYNQHKVAKFYIQSTALDNFAPISQQLTQQGNKFKFQIQNKIKIQFQRTYQNFRREDHLR